MGAQMSGRSGDNRQRSASGDSPAMPYHKGRRMYRSGSLSSQNREEGVEMALVERDGMGDGIRVRNPSGKSLVSGKSVRSRITSVAEYHDDLKADLEYGYNSNLVLGVTIIVLGSSFQFGWGIGCLNQPSQLIQDFFNQTYTNRTGIQVSDNMLTLLWSVTTALFIPGGMIGAFGSGFVADRFGRKKAILISHIFAIIGSVLSCCCVAAKSPELLMVGRAITGINCGLVTGLAPMYLAEITPFNLRGAIGTCHQLFITIGIFVSSLFGLREILGTADRWPYILILPTSTALLSLIVLPFFPDSPRYLMFRNDRKGAEAALQFYRKSEDVAADMEEMETESQAKTEKTDDVFTMKELFLTPQLRIPLLIAIMLQVIQQFSGINGVFFYSKSIYDNAGVSKDNIQYAVLGTNLVNVAMTVIAVPIMDKAGRRPLILFPMIIMDVILIIITTALNLQSNQGIEWMSYISIICVIGYVICFAIGLGPIPVMIAAELFRQGPRPKAMSIVSFTNWFCTLIIALTFELVQKAIKEFTFLVFLGLMIAFTIFVYFKVPETKNKTFEEIADKFHPGEKIEVEEVFDDDDILPSIKEGTELKENHVLLNHTGPENIDFTAKNEETQSLTKGVGSLDV